MKIRVARYVNVYFCLGLIFSIYCLGSVMMEIGPDFFWFEEDVILNIICVIFIFMPGLMYLLICPRAFAIVNVQENIISSSLFRKVKCKVKTDDKVWYVIIEANPEKIRGAGGTYIVISNKPFVYEKRKKEGYGVWEKERLFENYYDMTRMILIPYNDKTKKLFPIDKWIDCTNLKEDDIQVLKRQDWETVVEMMYDKQLDCFDDEVIRVIYSEDKSKRYLILKKPNGILTYLLEYICQFDDEEWNYISNQENALPAMWEPYYTDWGVSHFEKEEELMNELIHEPEYKQFFS